MQCNKTNHTFARIICLDHITNATTPFQKEVNNEVDEFLLPALKFDPQQLSLLDLSRS